MHRLKSGLVRPARGTSALSKRRAHLRVQQLDRGFVNLSLEAVNRATHSFELDVVVC